MISPATVGRFLRQFIRVLERTFAIFGVLCLVYLTCFHLSVISSGSMAPALRGEQMFNGDTVLSEKFSYWFRKPHRWEVVRFHDEQGIEVMKRVVGLPGETVALKDTNTVLINGQPVAFPGSLRSQKYYLYGSLAPGKTAECKDGYFVLGDDSADSQDSRFTGPLSRSQIKGRAWLRVWPPSRLGFVNP